MADIRHAMRDVALDLRRFLNMFRKLDREAVAEHYLKGTGIEIGALHNPLKVPAAATVRYVDRMSVADLRRQYPELASKNLVEADIIDNGETLETIAANSQDFVIANHFLEHCQNTIGALENLLRVLKKDGILYLCVPDKRYTFDAERPLTSFDHFVRDYMEGPAWSREGHFEEWVRIVEAIKTEPEQRKRRNILMEMDYSIHFHVWTQNEMFDLIHKLVEQFKFPMELEFFLKNNGEVLLIIRKTA